MHPNAGNSFIAFNTATGVATSHTLKVGGNIGYSRGYIDLFNQADGSNAVLEFTVSANASYTNTSTLPGMDLYRIVVNKSDSPSAEVVFLSTISGLSAPANATVKPVTFSNGVLVLSNSGPNLNLNSGGAPINIPSTSGLVVANGASVSMSSTTGMVLDGLLRVKDNSVANFSDGVRNTYIEYTSSGNSRIEILDNASMIVGGQIRRNLFSNAGVLSYVQNGGNLTVRGLAAVASYPKFEIDNGGSVFSMTGGNMYIQRGGGTSQFGDLYLNAGTNVISAGNIILSPVGATANQTYRITAAPILQNLLIVGAGAYSANATLYVQPLKINNLLTIGSGGTLTANNINVEVMGNLSVNGVYVPGNNTTSFTGVADQLVTLNSPISFNTLSMSKSGVLSFVGSNTSILGSLNLISGVLHDGGTTLLVYGNVYTNTTQTGSGKLALVGTTAQNISGGSNGVFSNLEVNSAVEPSASTAIRIEGNLSFANTGLYIGSNRLTLGLNSSVSGTSSTKFIRSNGVKSDQGVYKECPATPFNVIFPVGYVGKYTPAEYQVTSNNAVGTIRVVPVNESHPLCTDLTEKALLYYWFVETSGLNNVVANHTYTYSNDDALNRTESLYQVGRSIFEDWAPYYGGMPSTTGGVNATTNTITVRGVDFIFGEYTAGEPSELQQVLTYYSRDAILGGNWDDINAWSTDQVLIYMLVHLCCLVSLPMANLYLLKQDTPFMPMEI